ncbi:MAG TPA: LapA family protein [Ilumatobacter sp.]
MKHEPHDTDQHDAASGTDGPPIKLIALVVVVAALVLFIIQNGQDAHVDFLWMNGEWPAWTVIGISVAAGIVIDRLFLWQWRRARRRKRDDAG